MRTIGILVHPSRDLDGALAAVRDWAARHDTAIGQVTVPGQERRVADPVDVAACDLLLAIGGDGTVLGALGRSGRTGPPVLGIACGSLGALTSARADDIDAALDRYASGDWEARELPGLEIAKEGAHLDTALNDLVVVRSGAGQITYELDVDGELYARVAGDGVVLATPVGSSAYTIAAGGPLLAGSEAGIVVTPLADHGGSVPPLVVPGTSALRLVVDGGWSGARLELDGRVVAERSGGGDAPPFTLDVAVRPGAARLLDFGGETRIAGLRRRGVIADSPRLRARDAREVHVAP